MKKFKLTPINLEELKEDLSSCIEEACATLETHRCEPSEREVGTYPSDYALEEVKNLLTYIIQKFNDLGISPKDIDKKFSFEELLEFLKGEKDSDLIEKVGFEFVEMTTEADLDPKRIYKNRYYHHKKLNRSIRYTSWSSLDGNYTSSDDGENLNVAEVVKKQVVSYQWTE